jgi:hypothetical protein
MPGGGLQSDGSSTPPTFYLMATRTPQYWLAQAESLGLKTKAAEALRSLIHEHEALASAGKKGRTARKPRSAKAKGRRAVLEVRDLLRATFPHWEEDDILIQTTSVGGQDLHLSPRAAQDFPYAIESKNVEALNVWKTIEQAKANAAKKNRQPVIFCRRNTTPLHVVIAAEEFLRLVRANG